MSTSTVRSIGDHRLLTSVKVNSTPLPVPTVPQKPFTDKPELLKIQEGRNTIHNQLQADDYLNRNPAAKNHMNAWIRVDEKGNPSVEGNQIAGQQTIYDFREPGQYLNKNTGALVEVAENLSMTVIGPEELKQNKKASLELLFEIMAVNRGESIVEIVSTTDEDMLRRLKKLLYAYPSIAAEFKKNTAQILAVAQEKGLAVDFDKNYRDMMNIAGRSPDPIHGRPEQKKIILDGKETNVSWALAIQHEEKALQQTQLGNGGYWKSIYAKEREEFQTRVASNYGGSVTATLADFNNPDPNSKLTAANLIKDKAMAEKFLDSLQLMSTELDCMKDELDPSRLSPKPDKQETSFLEKIAKTAADQTNRLDFEKGPAKTLLDGLSAEAKKLTTEIAAAPTSTKPEQDSKKDKEETLKRIKDIQATLNELPTKQKEIQEKAEKTVNDIEKQNKVGTATRPK